MIKDVLHSLYSGGWVANLVVGVALFLILSGVGVLINTPRSKLYGAAVGITILFWVVILTIGQRLSSGVTSVPSEPASLSLSNQPKPSEQIGNETEAQPPQISSSPSSTPHSPPTKNGELTEPAMAKKDKPPSIDNSITNSPIVNSPGSIQAPGGTVINQGPPQRRLTSEEQAQFINFLRSNPKGDIVVTCLENGGAEACAFARQLADLLRASGWTVSNFSPMLGWGDPTKTIPDLYLLVQSNENAPIRAGVLQHALKAVGHDAVGFERPDNPPDFLQLTVSTLNLKL